MSGRARRWRWLLYGGAAGLALLNVLEAALHVIGHDDLWWDLAAGRHIVQHLEVPRVDVFSHTFAGEPWINLEWLSQVVFYLAYELAGESGVFALRLGLIVLIFAATLTFCLLRSRGSWLLSLVVVAFGARVCREFLDARPQLFTFLYAVLVLLILELFRRHGRRRLIFWIPVLLLFWTQQHNGYILGLLLVFGNLGAELGKKLLNLPADPLPWTSLRTLALVALLSAVAVVLNPWTFEAYTHPFEMSELVSGENPYLTVTEWQPPRFLVSEHFSPLGFWPLLFLVIAATVPIAFVRWRSFDWNDVALVAVLALFFALQHRRFIPLFAILALPHLCWALKFWLDWWFHGRRQRATWRPGEALPEEAHRRFRRRARQVAIACWLALLLVLPLRMLYLRARYAGGGSVASVNLHTSYYPDEAVRFLRDAELPGEMFNFYNWGGYLEFFLPEKKTFIDGRAQMVYSTDFYRDYLKVHYRHPDWEKILAAYGVGYLLLHKESSARLLRAVEEDAGWRQVFEHGTSAIWVRAPEPPPAGETSVWVSAAPS